ncbi:MAG: arsenic resistance N-acetyltransferase ArsN2 [Rhodanobacter sp.]
MAARIHSIAFDPAAAALLGANSLPTDDLAGALNVVLFGHGSGRSLAGVVGLEMFGPDVLLRSLVVAEASRGSGLGAALVAHAERYAVEHGARRLYLLTTTAEGFFERHGFARAVRSDAPHGIASSREFSGLCPASSTCMVKYLDR